MVSRILDRHQDAVAERLASAGDWSTPSVIEWLDAQQERAMMRRRATACSLAAWLLLVTAAVVSFAVAFTMSREARSIFSETFESPVSPTSTLVLIPAGLALVAGVILIGGLMSWWNGQFPGWSRTVSAIDWSASSDAVARLLAVGCTYPEAFRLAADVTRSHSSRSWLQQAADRVEQGGPHVVPSAYGRGDTAMLEALVETSRQQPDRQWRIAASHFLEVATRRLVLLLQTMPMVATIVSGLLVWIAIASTLGWMWRAVGEMMRSLT